MARAQRAGLALTPRHLFEHPVPADLTRAASPEPAGPEPGPMLLAPAQLDALGRGEPVGAAVVRLDTRERLDMIAR